MRVAEGVRAFMCAAELAAYIHLRLLPLIMEDGQLTPIHCPGCLRITQHEAKKVHRDSWSEHHAPIVLDHELEVSLLVCAECRTASLRIAKGCEQISDDWSISYVPPQPARLMPPWVRNLPAEAKHVASLLSEVHVALASEQLWLVAMGCRTLIDMFALARVGDVGGFKRKLERLVKEGFLTSRDRPIVEAVVEVGHEATHRTQAPSVEECHRCLNIVENLLHRLALDDDALMLAERQAKSRRGNPES
jgi:hypothetical protein